MRSTKSGQAVHVPKDQLNCFKILPLHLSLVVRSQRIRLVGSCQFHKSAFVLIHAILFHRSIPDMKRKAVQI